MSVGVGKRQGSARRRKWKSRRAEERKVRIGWRRAEARRQMSKVLRELVYWSPELE
jgi:hypothetical protein